MKLTSRGAAPPDDPHRASGPAETRRAGVSLHLTSLPSGRLDGDAYEFVDWLAEAGMGWWQILPIGPPDRHGSPYKSRSAFAAWPGFLAHPDAEVGDDEVAAFRDGQGPWVDEWSAASRSPRWALAHQVRFEREWSALRAHAAGRGVRLLGDVPIYVAPGSVDHRAHPELFRTGEVAGVPPDAFSAEGQLWGNPIFDWPAAGRRRYRWWTARLARTFSLVDATRIDHFRGFVAYWAVPAGDRTAVRGRWRRGPGRAVFDAARSALGDLEVVAEDLGVITEPVERLRRELGFPGMAVLQFGFDTVEPSAPHHPAHHSADRVAFTGTHDNDTARGWWSTAPDAVRSRASEAMVDAGVDGDDPWWSLIRLALASPATLAIVSAQDVLGLGSAARLNVPGRAAGNWRWRLEPGQLTAEHAGRLRVAVAESGRT